MCLHVSRAALEDRFPPTPNHCRVVSSVHSKSNGLERISLRYFSLAPLLASRLSLLLGLPPCITQHLCVDAISKPSKTTWPSYDVQRRACVITFTKTGPMATNIEGANSTICEIKTIATPSEHAQSSYLR